MSPKLLKTVHRLSSFSRDAQDTRKKTFKKGCTLEISSPSLIASSTVFGVLPNTTIPTLEQQRMRLEALKISSVPPVPRGPSAQSTRSLLALSFAEIVNRWEQALLLVRRNSIDEAQQNFLELIARAKGDDRTFMRSRLWVNIGLLYDRRDEHSKTKAKALECFRRALIDQANPLIHFLCGIEEFALNEFKKARDTFDQCLKWMDASQGEWKCSIVPDERDYRLHFLNFVLKRSYVRDNMRKCELAMHYQGNDELPELGKFELWTIPAPAIYEAPIPPSTDDAQRARGPVMNRPSKPESNSKGEDKAIQYDEGLGISTEPSEHVNYQARRPRQPRPATSVYSRDSGFGVSSFQGSSTEPPLPKIPAQDYRDLLDSFWSEASTRPPSIPSDYYEPDARKKEANRNTLMYPGKGHVLYDILDEMEREEVDKNQNFDDCFSSRSPSNHNNDQLTDVSSASTTISSERLFDLEAITGARPILRPGPAGQRQFQKSSSPACRRGKMAYRTHDQSHADGMFVPFPSPSKLLSSPSTSQRSTAKKPFVLRGFMKTKRPDTGAQSDSDAENQSARATRKLRKARRASKVPRPSQQSATQPRKQIRKQPPPGRAPMQRYLTYSMIKSFERGDAAK